jgi:nucleoside-diphosphate-sugar epimerase
VGHYLITGGKGFIGQHLTTELLQRGHAVTVWDIKDGNDVLHRKFAKYVKTFRYDAVIHLAAKVGRLFGEDDVLRTVVDNAGLSAHVAQICGEYGTKLVYASTSEVYGDAGDMECFEDLEALERFDGDLGAAILYDNLPHNAYGLSKRQGEEFCQLYAPDGLLIWRISMPYGPGLPAGIGRAAIINFLYNARWNLPITVHEGSERSWCWIGDTVRAMRFTLEGNKDGAYNIGRDDNPRTMREVARIACALTEANADRLIRMVPAPERQTVVKRLATNKIRALGWCPQVSLPEGMARTLREVRLMAPPDAAA